jgi:hypothetical protein
MGTILVAWLATASGLAPLMHRRYMIGAYPALILLGAFILSRIQGKHGLVAAGLLSWLLMIGMQGTIDEWRAGRWIAWQRQEDWRGAIEVLNQEISTNERLWLAPMLVETRGASIEPDANLDYLKYPLMSLYPVRNSVAISLLPNDRSQWRSHLQSQCKAENCPSVWLLARVSDPLPWKMDTAGQTIGGNDRISRIYNGRNVQLWKIEFR